MSYRWLLALILTAAPAFPVAKEILQLQRDLALLQDQVRSLQRALDERGAVTQQLLNQNLEAANRLATSLAVLDKSVHGQEKVLAGPVAAVASRVDTMATQFQALRDAVEELNSKMSKLQLQIVDIKNTVTALPPPAPAQPQQPAVTQVSAEDLFKNSLRDYQASNFNLAGPQFTDYVKLFPNTDQAADAQYYLGDIFYQQGQYDQAESAFQQVLERWPESKRAPDAMYKKGMSLLKQGRGDSAARELRSVVAKHPRSTAATQAKEALAGLGIRSEAPPRGGGARPAGKKDQ